MTHSQLSRSADSRNGGLSGGRIATLPPDRKQKLVFAQRSNQEVIHAVFGRELLTSGPLIRQGIFFVNVAAAVPVPGFKSFFAFFVIFA